MITDKSSIIYKKDPFQKKKDRTIKKDPHNRGHSSEFMLLRPIWQTIQGYDGTKLRTKSYECGDLLV
jgi:hypothetical protein